MSPQEKANELFEKMYKEILEPHGEEAKECALIAVKEIISALDSGSNSFNYWLEVKKEIELI